MVERRFAQSSRAKFWWRMATIDLTSEEDRVEPIIDPHFSDDEGERSGAVELEEEDYDLLDRGTASSVGARLEHVRAMAERRIRRLKGLA